LRNSALPSSRGWIRGCAGVVPRQNRYLASLSRGSVDVLNGRCFRVCFGNHSRWCGIHALPRPPARQPIAPSGGRSYRRTTVAPESAAAGARILARSRVGTPRGRPSPWLLRVTKDGQSWFSPTRAGSLSKALLSGTGSSLNTSGGLQQALTRRRGAGQNGKAGTVVMESAADRLRRKHCG
jgi:hypothetical protein